MRRTYYPVNDHECPNHSVIIFPWVQDITMMNKTHIACSDDLRTSCSAPPDGLSLQRNTPRVKFGRAASEKRAGGGFAFWVNERVALVQRIHVKDSFKSERLFAKQDYPSTRRRTGTQPPALRTPSACRWMGALPEPSGRCAQGGARYRTYGQLK